MGLSIDRQEEVEEVEIHGNPDDPYVGRAWSLTGRIPLQRSDKDQE